MRQTALNTVFELAKVDPRVVFIGSDLGVGTLQKMKEELPNQFFMEGISEQHLIGFAAGLAKEGYIPYLNTIANFFSRRALEQIILDVALHNLPVKIMASGGGMVYAPLGPTHTATDDLAHLLAIPNLKVFAPCDALEMKELIASQALDESPAYIRFGKGGETIVSEKLATSDERSFKYLGNLESKKVIISTGVVLQGAISVFESGLVNDLLIVHIPRLKLQDSEDLALILRNKKKILVVEEHQRLGGLFTQLLHYCFDHSISTESLSHISLGNEFVRKYGSQADHFENFGITKEKILEEITK